MTGRVVVVFGVRGKGEGKERRWGRGGGVEGRLYWESLLLLIHAKAV